MSCEIGSPAPAAGRRGPRPPRRLLLDIGAHAPFVEQLVNLTAQQLATVLAN